MAKEMKIEIAKENKETIFNSRERIEPVTNLSLPE